jgi:serine/threonine-protein kinase
MAGLGRLAPSLLTPALILALYTGDVAAQASASDKAAAEALFDQGLRLMKQNSFAEACPKLEESNRIDPAVGTLLYLGECYERVGKTASAWATFREAASLANNSGQPDRARTATSRAQELEPKLSRLSIELAPEVARVQGVVVKRGTQRIEPSLYGTPLPVDPGEYRVEVTAPGYEAWSTPITVPAGGGNASVRVPGLVKAPESAAPPPQPETTDESPAKAVTLGSQPPRDTGASSSLTTQETLGLLVGGVGLVGVGLGSYFGVRAISTNSDAEQHCPNDPQCRPEGLKLTEDARADANFSNIAFIAGGVLVTTGVVLYLTGGRSEPKSVALAPVVAPNFAAASLTGRF